MSPTLRLGPAGRAFAGLIACIGLAPMTIAECAHPFEMSTYSICFPKIWKVYAKASSDRVSGCNKSNGRCTGTGGGFPLRGAVFIFLLPADKVPGHAEYRSALDIVSSAAQNSTPTISTIQLQANGTTRVRECLVSRSLWFGKVWNEVYGLQVGSRLFRAWVEYNNEPGNVEGYRDAIVGILSSVSVRENVIR